LLVVALMNLLQGIGIGLAAGALVQTYPLASIGLLLFWVGSRAAKKSQAKLCPEMTATLSQPSDEGKQS